jgi:hypothetical protein
MCVFHSRYYNRENGVAFSFNVKVRCPDGVTYNVMNWIDLRFQRLGLFQDSGMYGLMAKTITKHSTLMQFIKRVAKPSLMKSVLRD